MKLVQKKEKGITRREFVKKAGKGATALGVASVLSSIVWQIGISQGKQQQKQNLTCVNLRDLKKEQKPDMFRDHCMYATLRKRCLNTGPQIHCKWLKLAVATT